MFDELAKLGATAYLVGGEAVEIYTAGQFSTGDIDVTTSNREATIKLLRSMGFTRTGMIWLKTDLGIAVQIVASYPSSIEKARTISIDGYKVSVVGVEDLIVDRLVAAKYWRSNPKLDVEQASVLLNEFKSGLDQEYLERRASEEKVGDYLDSLPRFRSSGKGTDSLVKLRKLLDEYLVIKEIQKGVSALLIHMRGSNTFKDLLCESKNLTAVSEGKSKPRKTLIHK